MIYLIDNQLPVGLASHLQDQGLEAFHVSQIDAKERSINLLLSGSLDL